LPIRRLSESQFLHAKEQEAGHIRAVLPHIAAALTNWTMRLVIRCKLPEKIPRTGNEETLFSMDDCLYRAYLEFPATTPNGRARSKVGRKKGG
jgi:hypothetical protein